MDGRGLRRQHRSSYRKNDPGAISPEQRPAPRDDGQSRIACTLRTTRPGRANNNASKTSPLQAEPKNDPFSTGKIDHHSKHLRERENKAQHNVQPKLQIPEKVSSEYKWKLEGKKSSELNFLDAFDALLEV